jgi:nicotinamidase-related amidase
VTPNLGARPETGAGAAGVLVDSVVTSTPYPWPWDARFSPLRCALLVHDAPEPALPDSDPAWPVVTQLARDLRAAGGLVVSVGLARPHRLTGHRSAPLESAELSPPTSASRVEADTSIAAPGWDGFFGTGLDGLLRVTGRDLLLLVGGWLEIGVHGTMRSANDRGYECLLVPDACIAVSEQTRAATISSTEMSGGIFGAVANSCEVNKLFAPSVEPTKE